MPAQLGMEREKRSRVKLVGRVTCRDKASGATVRTVVLYTKPGTVHVPTYTWKDTDRWINFPWSVLPVVEVEGYTPSRGADA